MERDAIIDAVTGVTKKWAKQRKKEERDSSARLNRKSVMLRASHVGIREAAWEIMEEAYLKASANGRLPAHARQITYAARGHIQRAGRWNQIGPPKSKAGRRDVPIGPELLKTLKEWQLACPPGNRGKQASVAGNSPCCLQ